MNGKIEISFQAGELNYYKNQMEPKKTGTKPYRGRSAYGSNYKPAFKKDGDSTKKVVTSTYRSDRPSYNRSESKYEDSFKPSYNSSERSYNKKVAEKPLDTKSYNNWNESKVEGGYKPRRSYNDKPRYNSRNSSSESSTSRGNFGTSFKPSYNSTGSSSGGRSFKPRTGSSFSSGRSFGGRSNYNSGRSRFGGGRSGGGRGGFKSNNISKDKYIFKALEPVIEATYETTNTYSSFNISDILKKNIAKKNYTYPTRIQDQSIPYILEGRDLLGQASTGSGKTAAFLIPMIDKALKDRTQKTLIIVPTRELANQIDEEFRQFTIGTELKSVIVIGGASMNKQVFFLRKSPQFVIGTPGRLKDLNNRRDLNLRGFNNIVLDEVDRMLDMGFIDDIKYLIGQLNQEKQSLFFSATMSKEAEFIANSLLKNPVKVQIESQSSAKSVNQDVVRVESHQKKIDLLHDILIQEDTYKTLIFSKTKRGSDRLSKELFERGFKVDSIHGDKTQSRRERVIARFRENSIKILVATDVAARGIDIPDITHVINYDEPATYEDYIHRIGRAGRAGRKGTALTFVEGK